MNKRIIMLMATALALLSAGGQVSFTNVGDYPPCVIKPDKLTTGLDSIFVIYDTQGVEMSFASSRRATWYTYDVNTWGYPTEITNINWDGTKTTLNQVIKNIGYIIYEGTTPHFYWVINYADYYLELNDISVNNEEPCNLLTINIDGHGERIPFCSTNGHPQTLDREIKLTYNTLVWNDSIWEEQEIVESFAALDQGVEITPPLCDTEILLTGDRFLEEWGIADGKEAEYYSQAVGCGATAKQETRDNENEKGQDSGYGGSAPVHITFTGHYTDAVVFREWEMATDEDFENVILQFNQDEVDYTFNDWGTYYMRYHVADASGLCEDYSDVFTITVSESELECSNAFSPGSDANNVWRVTYKSLIEFHCWIFNRWGTLVCEFTDPGDGWDGRYNGKLVDTGVYYYVITALGSDGMKYNVRGDISILNYKKGGMGTMGDGSGGVIP